MHLIKPHGTQLKTAALMALGLKNSEFQLVCVIGLDTSLTNFHEVFFFPRILLKACLGRETETCPVPCRMSPKVSDVAEKHP